ncbi:MAG: hypothetical protein LZF60_260045 [Nitrospira sp.]|nr:hypothetical protein [Nitrospira sp.]ULA60649.1 MAG: hypothetical protein LZF60_260045 [Nitrospira sp.]
MQLVITVDVEEDQWGMRKSRHSTTDNIRQLPLLTNLFQEFNIVPTYLVTFPVMSDDGAVGILRHAYDSGRCEIGMHCHSWTTPPFEESLTRPHSMLCNLEPALQQRKLIRLYDAVTTRVRTRPIAYRAGRWGYGRDTAHALLNLGCRIDSSLTPYTSWTHSYGPDYSCVAPQPYRFTPNHIFSPDPIGPLLEVPATIGFLRGRFDTCALLAKRLAASPLQRWRLQALLGRLGILRKVWLSPEQETTARMIQLVKQMEWHGYGLLNLVFHSSSLLAGCNPFVRTIDQQQTFLLRLRRFLEFCSRTGITFERLSSLETRFIENREGRPSTVVRGKRGEVGEARRPNG